MKQVFLIVFAFLVLFLSANFFSCSESDSPSGLSAEKAKRMAVLKESTQLEVESISTQNIAKGIGPPDYRKHAGTEYKPSYNEDPAIPVQCWIETSYGYQNACKYCHTNYLADIGHGNAFPLAEDQLLYSFPSPNLNKVNWENVTAPQKITERLSKEKIEIPDTTDPENFRYVRKDNWKDAYQKARPNQDSSWNNLSNAGSDFQLFPALNPDNLFPHRKIDPTDMGKHGYVDRNGFVREKTRLFTGWRAVNFFPYAIFTPLTGSVSGIYIRLPRKFMTERHEVVIEIYKKNLNLLERNIKNQKIDSEFYFGDAKHVPVKRGFYPVGTEIAHPLHYVDLNADGERGVKLDGLDQNIGENYEFPGTRSKRVKEIRYMYKWQDVDLGDIGEEESEEGDPAVLGKEWKGWIENDAGWILAAFIENREGELRPQTTEELLQCKGCHSSVGNTIDAVWSFQRKLPGNLGWREMDYGRYEQSEPTKTKLSDYINPSANMGELAYFYFTVVGADLFGIMPEEIKKELLQHAEDNDLARALKLKHSLVDIFNDEKLKKTAKEARMECLSERARLCRHFALSKSYLYTDSKSKNCFIKGTIFYPMESTALANIAGYRKIVLDQSFNLGKNVFGAQPQAIPFTFRSDGTVRDGQGKLIPVGEVIQSRPWGDDGVGTTPTGIAVVNEKGQPVDDQGNVVDLERSPGKIAGHVNKGGTFETQYNPILDGEPVKKQ